MKKGLFALLLLISLSVLAQMPKGIVMIDVSRHFMPISFLEKQIDELSRYGIPALHLHLTDAAGWRIEIKSHPELTNIAAWRTEEKWEDWWNNGKRRYSNESSGFGGYYTQDELRRLVQYATARGVSIIPEIEFPGHSEEVLAVLPHLACSGVPYTAADFCIGRDSTYLFLNDVIQEVADIFPSPYIHMGGDEAGGSLWKKCPYCKGMAQTDAMTKVNNIVKRHGKQMICWDEVLTDDLKDTSIVIMVWRNEEIAQKALHNGHNIIFAPGRYCYLDKYQDRPEGAPRAMGGYLPVDSIYAFFKKQLPISRKVALGLCLFTEYVPTPVDAERMLWPRVLALAEAIKDSPRSLIDFKHWALEESIRQRERGINAYNLKLEIGQRAEYSLPIKCISVGKKVKYNSPYHKFYPASGDNALTDGKQGGWSNTDGRWQGFLGPMDVTIDLGKKQHIHKVNTTFLQSIGPEIFFPSHFSIAISKDGNQWTPLYTAEYADDRRPDVLRTDGWNGHVRTRYIHIKAENKIHGGWLFTDEIIVD